VYDRHAPTLVTMARGVHELRQKLVIEHGENFEFGDVTQIHRFLDKFYMSRIGIRILIGQYVELHREEQMDGYGASITPVQQSPPTRASHVDHVLTPPL
jgi:pyruvate dehydrogenase kinase 2/3/4